VPSLLRALGAGKIQSEVDSMKLTAMPHLHPVVALKKKREGKD
jgi:hypothetical protein